MQLFFYEKSIIVATMKCPNCQHDLEKKIYHKIDVDECNNCEGVWLDFKELDELEDEKWDKDELKGTVIFDSFASEKKCPKCDKLMKGFNYRLHDDLTLEYCPDNHGFWLDKGEGESVLATIRQEEKDYERAEHVESDWIKHLWRLQTHPSFLKKLLSYLPIVKGEKD